MSKIKILAVLIILVCISVLLLFYQYMNLPRPTSCDGVSSCSRRDDILAFIHGLFVPWFSARIINGNQSQLVSPQLEKTIKSVPQVTPTPTNIIPKEIQYDSTTDLKKELDKVNPVVLEEDFQNLP